MTTIATQTSPLPEGWATILDTMDARLQEAMASADARAARLPAQTDAPVASDVKAAWVELAMRLQNLEEKVASAQATVDEEELAVAAIDDALRARLTEVESLRQRLAAWTGRA